MGIKTTTVIATILALVSTSAFAGTSADTSLVKSEQTRPVQIKTAPVLLDTPQTKKRRIKHIVIQPVEALVVRDASTADHGPFVYKAEKNTKTKTYRPATAKVDAMPNLFTK